MSFTRRSNWSGCARSPARNLTNTWSGVTSLVEGCRWGTCPYVMAAMMSTSPPAVSGLATVQARTFKPT